MENAIGSLISSLSGINTYPSNRTGGRLFPYSSIKAGISNQMLGNYTGVYDMSIEVNYCDTATKITQENFDIEYTDIFNVFYSASPILSAKLNAVANGIFVYMAKITNETPTIRIPKRAWQRGLTLNTYATQNS